MKRYLIIVFALLFVSYTKASHILGGNISYSWVGPEPGKYKLTLNLYRDCEGLAMDVFETVQVKSSCGANFSVDLSKVLEYGVQITLLCASDIDSSECNGGTFEGAQYYEYTGIVNLTPNCSNWTFSWSLCCRNYTINTTNSPISDIYLETKLITGNNNSAFFTQNPYLYVCPNQPYNYNLGVVDADGDSLRHVLIYAKTSEFTTIGYSSGYSGVNPIPGISIDSVYGLLNFTPTMLGRYLIAVETSEYNNQGQFKGSMIHEIEIIVNNCTNQTPSINSGFVYNLSNNAFLNTFNEIEVCGGSQISFSATYEDADTVNVLSMASNVASIVGDTNVNYTVSGSNPLFVNYEISIPYSASSFGFITTINDNNCSDFAVQNYLYKIKIKSSVKTITDQTLCDNQTIQLNTFGEGDLTWYDSNGNIIPVSNIFSCNPCASPIVQPSSTTMYIVSTNLTGVCALSDTVTIHYTTDNFNLNIMGDTATCLNNPIQLSAHVDLAGTYTYHWTTNGTLLNYTDSITTLTAANSGVLWVCNTTENSSGCSKKDSVSIVVSQYPQVEVLTLSDTVCINSSNQLDIQFLNNISPTYCGLLDSSNCNTNQQVVSVGTDSFQNYSSTYPAVFGNFYWGARHQMLYKASELASLGFSGGNVNSIAFFVSNLNLGNTTYDNIEIKIKCSSIDSLSVWETGMIPVFSINSYTVHLGWNTFVFDDYYKWDGISNLVFDFCFNNLSWSNNCSNLYSPTNYSSVLYYSADNSAICNSGTPTTSNKRPNIMLGYCLNSVDYSNYSYLWSPSGSLTNPNIYNPLTIAPASQSYQVIVTDNVGGCADTAFVMIQNNGLLGPSTPTINYDNLFLYTNSGYSYQWFFNGVAISGADSSSIIPIFNGDYMVQVFDSAGCSNISDVYNFLVSETSTNIKNNTKIFPIPASNSINIYFNEADKLRFLNIFSNLGMLVLSKNVALKENIINTEELSPGIYFYMINHGESSLESGKVIIVGE